MTTSPDPTLQASFEPTQQFAPQDSTPVAVRGPAGTAESRTEVRPEDPRRNPMTYLALAVALLALLLSTFALTRDNGPQQIDVGGKRCIVDRIDDNKADTLFCQT